MLQEGGPIQAPYGFPNAEGLGGNGPGGGDDGADEELDGERVSDGGRRRMVATGLDARRDRRGPNERIYQGEHTVQRLHARQSRDVRQTEVRRAIHYHWPEGQQLRNWQAQ